MADDASHDWNVTEEDELFLMTNLYPRTTGLPVTVWIGPRSGARHDARVKVSAVPGNRMETRDAAVVAVRPQPRLVHGTLDSATLQAVASWISLNEAVIIDHWDGATDGSELGALLRRLPG